MDDKAKQLKQLGFSNKFIDLIQKEKESYLPPFEAYGSDFEDYISVETKNSSSLTIEKSDRPQSFIFNARR